jgi:hypothetical protein
MRDQNLPPILRAMKLRYRTQALLNLGFYLMETRPLFFFIAILFFLVGGHWWSKGAQKSTPLGLRSEAMGFVGIQRRQYLF